jgi:hypothetical protein
MVTPAKWRNRKLASAYDESTRFEQPPAFGGIPYKADTQADFFQVIPKIDRR